ncbi:type III secretion system (T3SS) SseB-like protein [Haloactinospora alba]|uniref:Type III secretion system (T3SS) SseB-like protein n=1 Tax=Haloactinospora alba TaxID=405555 RepID=A0A543NHU3_9ACTN|nr:SseB family protein [Haloactinospora alba]TQN31403.1 type III secretion system (T3SS) SseB-like protein [Haloactinospora alba]
MGTTDEPAENAENEVSSFPANPVEESLQQALAHADDEGEDSAATEHITAFVSTLRDGDLWVPLPEGAGAQEDGSVALPTLELEGSQFIPVFTSQDQLSVNSADLPFTVIATRELAGLLPDGVGLALNPGNTASVPIYPDTIAALAGSGATETAADDQ